MSRKRKKPVPKLDWSVFSGEPPVVWVVVRQKRPRKLAVHAGDTRLDTALAREIGRLPAVDPASRCDNRFDRLLKRWYGGDWFDRFLRLRSDGVEWMDRVEC